MASLLNMSGGSLLNKGLPYDAEIEYLESTGTQYIDTMVSPTLDTEIQCVVIPITKSVNVINTDLQKTFGIHITNWSTGCWACYFGNKGYIPNVNVSKFKYSIPQSVILNYQKVTIDGVEYPINATFMSGTTMYMFKGTWADGRDNTRICSLKIKQNNIIVGDYIPVRKGTTGYMYDKVSKQLFGNAGTGDFILGPDKLPLSGVIDMGLPSGTLWAYGNIIKDANGNYAIGEPTDYGCYFSWGNIDGHNEGDGYNFNSDNYALTTGSQLTGDIQSDDALHDAAAARIGGGFYLPSGDQMTELFNSANTTNEWTTLNGVDGMRVTSLINGNSIFFPAAGYYNSTTLDTRGLFGYYWSSRRHNASLAYYLRLYSGNVNTQNSNYRYYGFPVRAVHN